MQKLKTRVKKKDVNPEWDEDLTLSLSAPDQKVLLVIFSGFYFEFILISLLDENRCITPVAYLKAFTRINM